MKTKFKVALTGNPNCGKTSIFNALTGARQHVGNYPGVTVESKAGFFKVSDFEIELIDLPGVYSLSSSSPEEEVVFKELTKPGIDLIINVIDSTIPRRSMYLTTQLAELHIPMLLVLNMSDEAQKKGLEYNIPKLRKYFGAPVVKTIGCRNDGILSLLQELSVTLTKLEDHGMPMLTYGADVDDAINEVSTKIDILNISKYAHIPSRFFAIKLLEHDTCVMRLDEFKDVIADVDTQIKHLKDKHAIDADTFMADCRYAMLAGACRDTISMSHERRHEISDKIDLVMTNKFLGLPLFLLILYLTFWFTFTCAQPFMDWIEQFFSWINTLIWNVWNPDTLPFLRSMLTDGIISGVGGVLVFLPNILFLFLMIAILEDSGYMSRAAFVMDGIMRKFGLQGRSFVPLVLGFGCNVPAIMATRVIESQRDRTVTILVLPLMSCGARLPIYALIIPAFFPIAYQASIMWLIYLIGVLIALFAARLMKATLFKGEGEVYLMELPPYRMPTLRSMMLHMWDRTKMYIHKAGTIILFTSIILYLCNTYPQKTVFSHDYSSQIESLKQNLQLNEKELALMKQNGIFDAETMNRISDEGLIPPDLYNDISKKEEIVFSEETKLIFDRIDSSITQITCLENDINAEKMEYSVSGRIGKFLEPIFKPIGYDWKLTTASLGALAAKEIFVSQLGILYSASETEEGASHLRQKLKENYTPLQGFCIMLFCLLSIPCFATLAVIKRELNSWKLMFAEAIGLFVFAYTITLIVYQIGSLFNIGTHLL